MRKVNRYGVEVYGYADDPKAFGPKDTYCPNCWEGSETHSRLERRHKGWEHHLDERVSLGWELVCPICGWRADCD